MLSEEKKFLDLDHLCDSIISQDDRAMFLEAIRCYQMSSHRAAVILAWCVTAERLYLRIEDLANEGDGVATSAISELQKIKGKSVYEENLITKARECDLFDDYEDKCLRFARDTRSKCAHPTGVVPSAEAVRHVLHICSQVVLCRSGYRGMSFVRNFVDSKLNDKHLFSDSKRVSEVCQYYYYKVPSRLHPQFAAALVARLSQSVTAHFRQNAVKFFQHLVAQSSDELARKIYLKLEPLSASEVVMHSVFVGLNTRDGILDATIRELAKSHLRDNLRQGPIDSAVFHSFANLCAIGNLEADDADVLRARFAAIADYLSNNDLLLERKRRLLLDIMIEAIGNALLQGGVIKGLRKLVSSRLFDSELDRVDDLIKAIISADWQDDDVKQLWSCCSGWSNSLKSRLLRHSESYLRECSEEFPDTVLPILEAAESLISDNVTFVPEEFEKVVEGIITGSVDIDWYGLEGEAFRLFVGQLDLLRTRHISQLPRLASLTLPAFGDDDDDDDGGA